MRPISMMMSLSLLMALSMGLPAAQTPQPETPPAQPAQPPAPAATEPAKPTQAMTLARVTEMLRTGTISDVIISQIVQTGSTFDLTIEDVVRLKRLGATPSLIQTMTRGTPVAAAPSQETAAPSPEALPAPSPDALTYKKILRMYKKGVPPDQIAGEITHNGLKETVELNEILDLAAQGAPSSLLIAVANGPKPPAGAEPVQKPQGETAQAALTTAEIMTMLQHKELEAEIVSEIETHGVVAPPSLQEAVELRKAGATDSIIAAINDAAQDLEADTAAVEDSVVEDSDVEEAVPPVPAFPPTADTETVTVLSYPAGAHVYLAPSRTRIDEQFSHDYLVGKTPISLTVPPGEYSLTVEKRAGTFEAGLLPAWRTMHEPPGFRSILDDTELTFDPKKCCLPGSISGSVDLRPVPEDQPRAIIGDQFDGLPPYLFDGEALQILRVRHTHVTEVMKLYHVRKIAGQARAVIAMFIPSEGNPLELDTSTTTGPAVTFDTELQLPQMQYLTDTAGQAGLATALGIEAEHLGNAIEVLKKVGKVILHQQVTNGVRLVTLSIDYNGRLRVTDQTILPETPFAPVPPKKGKKKSTPAPPPVPPLPALDRVVVPGLGSPRLNIENPGSVPVALILNDGEFCFAPGAKTTECVIDPGTHEVWMMSGGEKRGGGTMHLSYHSRSTMKMPPMPAK